MPEYDWVFEDAGPHGGAWYWARGTDAATPLPESGSLSTPFGDLAYSHAREGISWFADAGGRYWGVEAQWGGGQNELGEDPLLGLVLMAEAWHWNLTSMTARWGYDADYDKPSTAAYIDGLAGQLGEYSPECRGLAHARRTSHLEG